MALVNAQLLKRTALKVHLKAKEFQDFRPLHEPEASEPGR